MSELDKLTEKTLGGLSVKPVSKQADYLNMLVYGNPGVGKTVFAGSAAAVEPMGPVLFIDVEGGTLSIRDKYPSVDVVRVQTWKDMQDVYDALYAKELVYNTVVLDSLTEIQKFSMYTVMGELIKEHPDRDPDVPGMREWGKSIEQIRRLVRAFRDLPMHTIFTALANHSRDTKSGLTITTPSLPGKLAAEIAGFMDIVLYMYIKVREDDILRLLLTVGTDTQVAKDRSDQLPSVIEQPTMETVHKYIYQKDN